VTGTEEDRLDPGVRIGQALYTYAEVLPNRKQGEGFIAASPSLATKMDWLAASCRPLIGYVGDVNLTAEQKAEYRPVGKHIHTNKTFIYRKKDVGRDSHKRSGNYLIHFLVADSSIVCLSDVLRIKSFTWDFRAARVTLNGTGRLQSMPEVDLTEFRDQLVSFAEFEEPDESTVTKALLEFTRKGVLEATDLSTGVILGMLSVLPPWADYAAELVPEWSERGAVRRLHLLGEHVVSTVGEDRRLNPKNENLKELRQRLSGIRTIDELRASLISATTTQAKPSRPDAEETELIEGMTLNECIGKWLKRAESMTQDERKVIANVSAEQLVDVLAQQERHLPPWHNHDDVTLPLLERCGGVDQKLLGAIMPLEDESVSRYVTACSNSAVLEAAVWLNRDNSRQVDIDFPDGVAATILLHLVKLCANKADFHEGLIRSVRISFFGKRSFVRRLLRSPGMDFKYLYSRVLPAAADGDSEVLWALASVNPEVYVSLMRSTEIYEIYSDALISALRRVESQPSYGSISSLMERWQSRETADPKVDVSGSGKLSPVKRGRASRGKSPSRSRRWHRNN
jgi:GTPase-associated protein 1, N-terminal domain type 2